MIFNTVFKTCFLFSCMFLIPTYAADERIDQPLHADVWDYREDPDQGILDAMIVKSHTEVSGKLIRHYRLIRIFSERGKDAVASMTFDRHITRLDGRVVDRNGQETRIDYKRDLMKVLQYETGSARASVIVLVPPGLTDDCVVELSWSVKAEYGLPIDQLHSYYLVPERYYCLEKVFEVPLVELSQFSRTHISQSFVEMSTRLFWSDIAAPAQFTVSILGGNTVLTYSKIPALAQMPFGLPYHDQNAAAVQMFRTMAFEGLSTQEFWDAFVLQYVKIYYDDFFQRSAAYGRFIDKVRSSMPDQGAKGARHVFKAFRAYFRPIDLMTWEERSQIKTAAPETLSRWDLDILDNLLARRYISRINMPVILLYMMRDCGIPAQLMFTTPKFDDRFDPREKNAFALDILSPIVAFEHKEGWLTFPAFSPELGETTVPERFRGKRVMVVDPEHWKSRFIKLSRQSWKRNRLTELYITKVEADGKIEFKRRDQANGTVEASWRRDYRSIGSQEREDLLRDEWSKPLRDWQLGQFKVDGVEKYKDKITRSGSGITRINLNNLSWLALDPFPGSTALLEEPRYWPGNRTQPIHLGPNRGIIARNSIQLPQGWSLKGSPSWKRENKVGRISFKVTSEGSKLKVEREMVIKNGYLPAEDEALLKEFTIWMHDAMAQRLAIQWGGNQ